MRSGKGKSFWLWLAIGATALAVAAIVGFRAMDRFGDTSPAGAGKTTGGPAHEEEAAAGKVLDLGDVARISSNYRVAVTELTLYAGDQSQYLAATIKAAYTGKDKGEPWADLTVEFSRPKAQTAGETDCPIDADDATEQPAMEAGDEVTYVVCIDLPTKEIDDGKVSVEEALTKGRRAFWSTKGAETKEIPSIALPGTTSGSGSGSGDRPDTSFRKPPAANRAANDKWAREYIEDVEEYKDWVEDMDEFADKNKNKFDDDDIEEYEDWKKEYDEQIAEYEKWKKEYEASRD